MQNGEAKDGLSAALENIRDGFFSVDRAWRFVYANNAACRLFGQDRGGLLGRDLRDTALLSAEDPIVSRFERAMDTQAPERFEAFFPGPGIWAEVEAHPAADGLSVYFRDNTEHKRIEEELRQSRELLRAVVDGAQDAIYAKDTEGRFLLFNREAARRTGRDPAEVIGRDLAFLFHPDEARRLREEDLRIMGEGKTVTVEETVTVGRDGPRTLLTTKGPVRDAAGRVIGMFGIARDVTGPREAEEKLRLAEERYRSLFERAVEGFFQSIPEGRFLAANPSMARMLGYDSPEALIDEVTDIGRQLYVDPEERERMIRALVKKGSIENDETQLLRKDGTSIWVSRNFHAVFDETGRIDRIEGTLQDITYRKQAEEAIRRATEELERRVEERTAMLSEAYDELQAGMEERRKAEGERAVLSAAVERAGEGVFVLTPDKRFVYANPTYCAMIGYNRDDLLGKGISLTRGLDFQPSFYDALWSKVRAGEAWSGRVTRQRKDGAPVHLESTLSAIRDTSGDILYFVGVARSIGERMELEKRLRQTHKMEAIGTLAGGIAHDFNNILSIIIGNAELALDDLPEREATRQGVQQIFEAANRGRELVAQILTFSRKTADQRKPVALTPLFSETQKLLRASIPTTVEIVFHVSTANDVVLAEPSQMQQILMNLATNAAHAMEARGGRLFIGLSDVAFRPGSTMPDNDMEPGHYVQLTVKDTGRGMTADVQRRIFEPFFTTKRAGRGTGMGLAVVYGIVKGQNGGITVQSKPGKGSTFTVFIPLAAVPAETKVEKATQAPVGTESILFVDDEPVLAEMTRTMLERLGYTVMVSTGGQEAWELFSKDPSRFDLVITDQTMPGISGVMLVKKILGLRPDLPIILCTGYSETISAEKAKRIGVAEFITKPILRIKLAESIRKVLDEKGTRSP